MVSHNTVIKAYSELENKGFIEIRHGAGAFVSAKGATRYQAEKIHLARNRVRKLVEILRQDGLSDEEIHRLFDAEVLYPDLAEENQ